MEEKPPVVSVIHQTFDESTPFLLSSFLHSPSFHFDNFSSVYGTNTAHLLRLLSLLFW